MEIIRVQNVHKEINGISILKDINFRIKEGSIIGLLGPNGAGKTTMLRLMNGVIDATSGTMSIFGFDPKREGEEIRKRSGIVTESASLYHEMSALANLNFFADIYEVSDKARIGYLLEQFNLAHVKDQNVGTFSTGMKKRLALAKALLHKPRLLFLDEPTNGLDPEGINEVIHYLKRINEEEGVTIVICSHVLHQLEDICDSFLFLKKGQLVEKGNRRELEEKYLKEVKLLVETNLKVASSGFYTGYPFEKKGEGLIEFTLESKDQISPLIEKILTKAWVHECKITNRSLEALYFKIKGDTGDE
ncbi:ABC transporter ATP-binding protein [Bacillus sp. FJAT-27445]|uniref:ABC transporter ATP-binding protein n=1 Tax=Bacillus sp. FJAT-27445 TaxID=1679166 RepID=UPI000743245E|nr:ABC transporter ATP-binding protein [Bacillus sp. FJAT-27445]